MPIRLHHLRYFVAVAEARTALAAADAAGEAASPPHLHRRATGRPPGSR